MKYLPYHIVFMALAMLCKIVAISAPAFFKRKTWWLRVHKALNYVSLGSLGVGAVLGVVMTEKLGETAAGLPHRAIGIAAVLGALLLVFVGRSIFSLKVKERIAARKGLHRWLGRAQFLLLVGATVLGILLAIAIDQGLA